MTRLRDLPFEARLVCPCCGYPTLTEAAAYEICELCDWEDDGQSDTDGHAVRGGPNGKYSLAAARENFRRYLVMYSPDADTRVTGADTPAELNAKRALVTAFDRLRTTATDPARALLLAEVHQTEAALEAALHRAVREYENEHRSPGSA
jgi:hypothetical protein